MADALARDLADAQQISRTLQNKVIRLERERDDALKRLEGEQATSYALYQELLKLTRLVKKLEWSGDRGLCCPVCQRYANSGSHAPACELEAALEGR